MRRLRVVLFFVAFFAPVVAPCVVFADRAEVAEESLLRGLAVRRVSFSFQEFPLADVVEFMATTFGRTNILLDPRARIGDRPAREVTVTLAQKNVTMLEALGHLCVATGLHLKAFDGAVVLTDDADMKPMPMVEAPPALAEKLDEAILSFTFNDQPVLEALDFLSVIGDTPIVPDASLNAKPEPEVTLKVNRMTFRNALNWMCRLNGLAWRVEDGKITVSKFPETPKKQTEAQK